MILFNELEFEKFTQITINKLIEKVNESDILNADLEHEAKKIIDSFTFTVPVIDQTNITSSLSMEDSSGNNYSDSSIDINNDAFATATYTVPFTGNSEIFKVKPLEYQHDNQQFILENNNLKFKIRTDSKSIDISEECKSNLILTSSKTIYFIENNLQKLSVCFKEFKNEMTGPVIYSLKKRKEELMKAADAAKDINIFNSKNE